YTPDTRIQCLCSPPAEGGFGSQSLSFPEPPAQPCHFGVGAGLIKEDQATLMFAHEGLTALDPLKPRRDDIRPVLLRCQKAFFYSSGRSQSGTSTGSRDRF